MISRNGVSEDFPQYFKIHNVPINRNNRQTNVPKGKKCYAERTGGVSPDMPPNFNMRFQLVSPLSRANMYLDENYIKKSLDQFNKSTKLDNTKKCSTRKLGLLN